MIDQHSVDLFGIIPTTLKKVAGTNGGEYAGACPFCGGKDRFRVWNTPKSGNPSMWCRKCDFKGDAVAFVMAYQNLDFAGALEFLRLESTQERKPKAQIKKANPSVSPGTPRDDYACFTPAWQHHCDNFITECVMNLDQCEGALWYLNEERGLSDATIRAAELGWNPKPRWIEWGDVKYQVPRGIVIPWLFENRYWRVRFRCLDENYRAYTPIIGGHEQKYPQIKGSANGLYFGGRSEMITPRTTVVLVESEFDALALTSNAPLLLKHGLRAIATGGSQNAKLLTWVSRLAVAKCVILAFDADEAGANASLWWSQALTNTYRLRPYLKDITDMVNEGIDLYGWLGYVQSQPKQLVMFETGKVYEYA